MLKKIISYKDLDGKDVVEEHYFHLNKAELMELELSHKGGFGAYLEAIVATEDGKQIIEQFKTLILMTYGIKSEDGRRFIKTEQLRVEFQQTEAFSSLFMSLATDAEVAADFINGLVPADLEEDLKKIKDRQDEPLTITTSSFETDGIASAVAKKLPGGLTEAEVHELSGDELRARLLGT